MSEAVVQAMIRLVIVFITAGLTALGTNLTILQDSISDPVLASMVPAIAIAVISAVLKYLGGPTAKAPVTVGRGAPSGSLDRPSVFSV